ncbi:MAG: hypothetical protein F6K25_19520 [Okeania sp. SIO2G4]|uniref:hypothetical protein n=1 Tax=unclassified Okeania TaxID=2634635 RepID=UPI0013B83CD2|nr:MULTISPECIES: hypothetical protein [unclassified Okeania]NEP44614.1 hypothetical protein [Okeania sp. SIO2H7]NEP74151.1 hypothetical protein [Okeania sp. SIO2G5]NEP95026.1 hypothetical protein [Okeania sp. SIO2F5]NEQ92744.1 hypothetical protein [Okeania sp. SIO2G4]
MQVQENKFSWYDVPEDVKSLLMLAVENWEDTETSENYINQALAKTEGNLDILIGAYRYFFYKNNMKMSLELADMVINEVKKRENLPDDWQEVKTILASRKNEQQINLLITAYAASGLIIAKMGDLAKAKAISEEVQEIDDKNDLAKILFDVITRPPDEDED